MTHNHHHPPESYNFAFALAVCLNFIFVTLQIEKGDHEDASGQIGCD